MGSSVRPGAARPHIVAVTLAAILFALAFGIGLLALTLLAFALGPVGAVIGIVGIIAWFLLLLVWWSLVTPAIVLENKGVGDGLSRSRQLVEGYGWPVLGTLALVFLILVGFTLALGAVLFPLDDDVQGFVSQVVSGALAAPFVALVLTLLYFRLRAAKETPAPAPPPPTPARLSFLQILPLAFVMIAGPQMITSFFLATSQRWAACSAASSRGRVAPRGRLPWAPTLQLLRSPAPARAGSRRR